MNKTATPKEIISCKTIVYDVHVLFFWTQIFYCKNCPPPAISLISNASIYKAKYSGNWSLMDFCPKIINDWKKNILMINFELTEVQKRIIDWLLELIFCLLMETSKIWQINQCIDHQYPEDKALRNPGLLLESHE